MVPAPTLSDTWSIKRHASLLKLCSIKSEAVIALLSMKPLNVWCMCDHRWCDMGPPIFLAMETSGVPSDTGINIVAIILVQ